ncbi:phosphonoacetate hydrolase [Bradyrhizobium japonicum]
MASEIAHPLSLAVNGRDYFWPSQTTVIICFDGCDPAYLDAARKRNAIPAIDRMTRDGFASLALAAMPTFTNPNNVSIVCGVPPAVHGVSGNFYLDRTTGEEIMMVDATPMRAPTILATFANAGAKVVAITAKDKLCKALGHQLDGIAFSAEKAHSCTIAENGIEDVTGLVGRETPELYSADLSLFVLDAGIRLLEMQPTDLMYLSLSDYVQHKHAPNASEAIAFMHEVDQRIERLMVLGAVVGIVADHGMNDMAADDGEPNVLYLGDVLDAEYGPGTTRVICPITDPFVRHHGAMGGFVRVHLLAPHLDPDAVASFIRSLPGVALALSRDQACERFELPEDREGDLAIVAEKGTAIGARAKDHDLSQLAGERLRSHGGLAEQEVPFLLSHPITPQHQAELGVAPLRNFDIFAVALNCLRT